MDCDPGDAGPRPSGMSPFFKLFFVAPVLLPSIRRDILMLECNPLRPLKSPPLMISPLEGGGGRRTVTYTVCSATRSAAFGAPLFVGVWFCLIGCTRQPISVGHVGHVEECNRKTSKQKTTKKTEDKETSRAVHCQSDQVHTI